MALGCGSLGLVELDPETLLIKKNLSEKQVMDGDKRWTNLANGGRSVEGSTIECPFLLPYEHKGTRYYYLFRTWGENGPRRWNKYEIMVGRATSPKGPYLDKKAFVWIKNAVPVPAVHSSWTIAVR